jgi:hypothetical protein
LIARGDILGLGQYKNSQRGHSSYTHIDEEEKVDVVHEGGEEVHFLFTQLVCQNTIPGSAAHQIDLHGALQIVGIKPSIRPQLHTAIRQHHMKVITVRIDEDLSELFLQTLPERIHCIIMRLTERCRLVRLIFFYLLIDLIAVLGSVFGKLLEAFNPRRKGLDLGGSSAGGRTGGCGNEVEGKLDEFKQSRAGDGEVSAADVLDDCVDEFAG